MPSSSQERTTVSLQPAISELVDITSKILRDESSYEPVNSTVGKGVTSSPPPPPPELPPPEGVLYFASAIAESRADLNSEIL